jgi:hypothetical protein
MKTNLFQVIQDGLLGKEKWMDFWVKKNSNSGWIGGNQFGFSCFYKICITDFR